MIKTTVSGQEDAKKAIQDAISELNVSSITVGIHEGAEQPDGSDINMATLGAIQHFGNDNIPARPWLDVGVESGAQDYMSIIEPALENDEDLTKALNQVGVIAVGKVQEFITQLKSPPNSQKTIAKKKSSNPLINTGAMRSSISYQIQKVKPEEGL